MSVMKKVMFLIVVCLNFVNAIVAQTSKPIEIKQRKFILKTNVVAPVMNTLKFSAETQIAKRQSLEMNVNFIGRGYKILTRNPKGFAGNFAYRYYVPNTSISNSCSSLSGYYVSPSVHFGAYERNFGGIVFEDDRAAFETYREKVSYNAFIINTGYQFALNKRLVFDFNVGLGKGKTKTADIILTGGRHYGVWDLSKSGIFVTSNFKIGYAF